MKQEAQAWRPIQYLGSKLRSLDSVLDIGGQLPGSGRVTDLFSGTTVVAQAFAATGAQVTAVDVAGYSQVFARALLGIDRTEGDVGHAARLVAKRAAERAESTPLRRWLEGEDAAVAAADGAKLLDLSVSVPQVWRRADANRHEAVALDRVGSGAGGSGFRHGMVCQSHYAGTYLGVRQAVEIDALRVELEHALRDQAITSWQHDVMLTAVLHLASSASFSAGKHFAQPHNIASGKRSAFLEQRILGDRSRGVLRDFSSTVEVVEAQARPKGEGHYALRSEMEDLNSADLRSGGVVYADPPYTAQQYSRFYHVLDVIVDYQTPELQMHRGRVTKGLYPDGKHKSRFCSRRQARGAFRDLATLVRESESSLVLSYSASTGRSTGNGRMVSLEGLVGDLRKWLPSYRIGEHGMSHRYRKFNAEDQTNEAARDVEVLIVAEAPC